MTGSASVVIGANFGDEAKGAMTDYLSDADTLVCRFNGGAQAGHTVQTPDGLRHVFHHFGSGTLRGADTLLSRFFIVNPYMLIEELVDLRALGLSPKMIIDHRAPVTTPFDMMINQMIEEARGGARHGSCGLGINETIKRTEAGFYLPTHNLSDGSGSNWLWNFLQTVRREWVPERLNQLGMIPSPEWRTRLGNDGVLEDYIERVEACWDYIGGVGDDTVYLKRNSKAGKVVFEGAQGLLLDEDHPFFPHVTHSHTGLHNVAILAKEAGIEQLDVTYMTRAYATRHGAGPFPNEVAGLAYDDPTNVPNMWQGSLRFGRLDLSLLAETIQRDMKTDLGTIVANFGVAVTCLDQVAPDVTHVINMAEHTAPVSDFLRTMEEMTGIPVTHTSYGPTRADVRRS